MSSRLQDQYSTTELQKPLPTTWARVQYMVHSKDILTVLDSSLNITCTYTSKNMPPIKKPVAILVFLTYNHPSYNIIR